MSLDLMTLCYVVCLVTVSLSFRVRERASLTMRAGGQETSTHALLVPPRPCFLCTHPPTDWVQTSELVSSARRLQEFGAPV